VDQFDRRPGHPHEFDANEAAWRMGIKAGLLTENSLRLWVRRYRNHRRAAKGFQKILTERTGSRLRRVGDGPVAPMEVIATTALMHPKDIRNKSRRQVFMGSGMNAMGKSLRHACNAGLRLDRAEAAFELGCGGGRLIRHLRRIDGLRLVGTDLQAEAIEWCRENVPGIEFHTNDLEPPLSFAEDDSFDFAFAYSVFTHIPLEFQLPWVTELARILKPGGVAVVTTLGPAMARIMMNDDDMREFERDGTFTMGPDHPRVSASSATLGSWDVFMTDEFTRQHFRAAMEVVEYVDEPQAWVVLKKQ